MPQQEPQQSLLLSGSTADQDDCLRLEDGGADTGRSVGLLHGGVADAAHSSSPREELVHLNQDTRLVVARY